MSIAQRNVIITNYWDRILDALKIRKRKILSHATRVPHKAYGAEG